MDREKADNVQKTFLMYNFEREIRRNIVRVYAYKYFYRPYIVYVKLPTAAAETISTTC